jgi:hypothetical protein
MTVEPRIYRPADYYSGPSPERVLPQWASFGCGAASALILVLVFAGGAYLAHGGFTELMDMVFSMTMGELRGMYTKDVTAPQKKSFDDEIETLRANMRNEKITVQSIQPLLKDIQKVSADKKVDAHEVGQLLAEAKKINARAKKP